MPFNGAGVYNPIGAPDFPAIPDTTIRASQYNNEINDIAAALTNCVTRNGQSPATADLPMGTWKHTNVGNAVLGNQYAAYGQVQKGAATWLGTAGGTANALTAAATPTLTAYTVGQAFRLKVASNNTGAATVNIDGVGAVSLTKNGSTPLSPNDLLAGDVIDFRYDGTSFIVTGYRASLFSYGTVAERPAAPAAGSVYYATDTAAFQGYTGSVWTAFGGGLSAGSDLASAATLNLSGRGNEIIRVTGTAATGALTMNIGQFCVLVPTGAWPLTYHATDNPVPGAANYTCAVGDTVFAFKDNNGTLHVVIEKGDGTSVTSRNGIFYVPTPTYSAGAMTIPSAAYTAEFRSSTNADGTITKITATAAALVVPSGATLGTSSGIQSDLALLLISPTSSTVEYALINTSGAFDISEVGLISTTAISSGSTSSGVAYSTTARSNVPYRVIGLYRSTQTTAGTWAQAMTLIQGAGGLALTMMASLGYGQGYQDVSASRATGTTYYNSTGRPIFVLISADYGGSGTLSAFVNGAQVGLVTIATVTTVRPTISFIVPPGRSYRLDTSTGPLTFVQWVELRT